MITLRSEKLGENNEKGDFYIIQSIRKKDMGERETDSKNVERKIVWETGKRRNKW